MRALDIARAAGTEPCRPWPRHVLSRPDWAAMVAALTQDPEPALLGLWADTLQIHALLRDEAGGLLASVTVEAGSYPALSPARPAASLLERMIRDLWGHAAEGGDERPWLDHGRWPLAHPLSPRPGLPGGAVEPPAFPAPEGQGVMQVPLGPIRGLTGEPAHVRLSVRGAEVLWAEARLGYAHKGTLALMRGKSPRAAARFVARLAAEATVAHSVAFARAAEAASQLPVPPRAAALRAVMLVLERLAGRLDDLARLADAAGRGPLQAVAGRQREALMRAAGQAFGHRLMMDAVLPGGLAGDIATGGIPAIRAALDGLEVALPALRRHAEPLLARLELVGSVGAGERKFPPLPLREGVGGGGQPHTCAGLPPPPNPHPQGEGGKLVDVANWSPGTHHDAAARVEAWLQNMAADVRRLPNMLEDVPEGPISADLLAESGEGLGDAGSQRGRVWHWLRLDHGQIAAAFPCDPGWALWPLAEAAMAGAPAEEEAMIRLSFGLPVSAIDL